MANPNTPTLRLEPRPERSARRPKGRPDLSGWHTPAWRAWAATLLWYLVTVLLMTPYLYYHPYPTRIGQPVNQDIVAPFKFQARDQMATELAKAQLLEKSPKIWVRDDEVESKARQRLQGFGDLLHEVNPQSSEGLRSFTDKLYHQLNLVIDEVTANQFTDARLRSLRPPLQYGQVSQNLEQIITNLYNDTPVVSDRPAYQAHLGQGSLELLTGRGTPLEPPKPDTVLWWPNEVRTYLLNIVLPQYYPGPEYAGLRQAMAELLMRLLGPNIVFNPELTHQRYEEEFAKLERHPLYRTYAAGELIAKKGEELTPLQADALKVLNQLRHSKMQLKMVGVALFTALCYIAVALYLLRFRRDMPFNAPTITLHILPPLMGLFLGQVMLTFGLGNNIVMLWYPAALVGMLSAILIAPQVAFMLVLVSTCLFGIITDQDLAFMILALFGGFLAVIASRWVRARAEVMLVGVQVGLVNLFILVVLGLVQSMQLPDPQALLWVFLNGIFCAFGTIIFLVIFERAFDIVTDLRLLELTGLKHPLLAQFEEKAPGSYQHVLNVTKLAEAAAQAIGANYLLVRAGAYFHDVGKMIKPKYFGENQITLDDKKAHSRLSPYMSVLIIKNHVKEGVDLARRYGLPRKVVDFIPQHHGTGLIRYFYNEALKRYSESEAVDEPREEDFRYPGPKPQSIEAAIVMLADSVEATATSRFTGGQVNEDELRRLVQTTISEKFDDGQFDECDLTLRHLYLIREAFVKTLLGRYHFRVAYPSLPRREGGAARPATEAGAHPAAAPIAVAGPVGGG